MQTIEEMHAHYMAVRARLNGGKPKMVVVHPAAPEPPPAPYPDPLIVEEPEAQVILKTPAQIVLSEVAEKHDMTVRDLKGESRKLKFVRARQEAAYRLRNELEYSLSQIGRLLWRDHTTILHGINQYKKNLAKETEPFGEASGVSSG